MCPSSGTVLPFCLSALLPVPETPGETLGGDARGRRENGRKAELSPKYPSPKYPLSGGRPGVGLGLERSWKGAPVLPPPRYDERTRQRGAGPAMLLVLETLVVAVVTAAHRAAPPPRAPGVVQSNRPVQAALQLNARATQSVLENIRMRDATLAMTLAELIDSYRFDVPLAWIERAERLS